MTSASGETLYCIAAVQLCWSVATWNRTIVGDQCLLSSDADEDGGVLLVERSTDGFGGRVV